MSKERALPPINVSDETIQEDFILAVSTTNTGENLAFNLKQLGIPTSIIPALMRTQQVFEYMEEVFSQPDLGFTAAALLALTDTTQLNKLGFTPPDVQFADKDIEVNLGSKGFWLCSSAENRLLAAMEEDGLLVITDEENEPVLLQKFRGKNVALCVNNTVTATGRGLVAGQWYAPATRGTIKFINRSFDHGEGRVEIGKGSWTLLRSAQTHKMEMPKPMEEFIADVTLRSDEIPPFIETVFDPTDGGFLQSRRDYRRSNFERISIA